MQHHWYSMRCTCCDLGWWCLKAPAHGVPGGLQCGISTIIAAKHSEHVVVGAASNVVGIAVHAAVKLVKDAVILIQITQLHHQHKSAIVSDAGQMMHK